MIPAALVSAGIALAYVSDRGPTNLVTVRASTYDHSYRVQNLPDKQKAADLMGVIHQKLDVILNRYKEDANTIADPRINVMVERFDPRNLCENNVDSDSTAYSENKGERIVLCLRSRQKPYPLVDENTVMFVVLHEMAHLMTTTIGHTPEFWANFRRLLQDAIGFSVYKETNYNKEPVDYCGMTISDSPL